ncbi:hypothetical protein POL68_39825 [Stigmatella sp. ncwal1]|uniref:Protein kinase domain-containing protein n=1 Tax=Stigmatella ashevillensis TaxID=2995309 RepID=A0ABT5DMA8_9BACT|nr:hypothetical protein [Stigmatella ashevillena]MDC0714666.1 hypothetical protein [Stigmatella ashevillena]
MQNTLKPEWLLAPLPVGTRIGPWRVMGWHHRGAYGAVYQAVLAKSPRQPVVALKLALFPGDPRFAREVELLSRIRHPCVPRLIDHGHWVTSQLNALVLCMLSLQPESRGTAQELAESLELAAARSDTTADRPLFDAPLALPEMAKSPAHPKSLERKAVRAPLSTWIPSGTALAVGLLLSLWFGQSLSERERASSQQRRAAVDVGARDAGSVAVGDSALTAPSASPSASSSSETVALDLPPEPLPGQNKPDANGRCPRRGQVAIRGSCWIEQFTLDAEACKENADTSYVYQGRCYVPAFPPRRQPTSTQSPNLPP